MKKISELLRRAAQLPRTKHAFARNSTGSPVSTDSPEAVSFCAVGAICHVVESSDEYNNGNFILSYNYLRDAGTCDAFGVMGYSDRLDDESMQLWWQRAIDAAEQDERAVIG